MKCQTNGPKPVLKEETFRKFRGNNCTDLETHLREAWMHQLSPIMKILSFRYPRKLNGRKSREAQKLRRADPIGLILNRLLEKQKGQEDPVDVSNLLEGMKRRRNRTNYQEGSHK